MIFRRSDLSSFPVPAARGPRRLQTGHGLKQPEAIRFDAEEFTPITPTLEALREKIKQVEG